MEDGFVGCEKIVVCCAFAQLCTLFVDGEVDDGGDGVEDVEAVFQADFHAVCGCVGLEEVHVGD
jgi:hypothetical protein